MFLSLGQLAKNPFNFGGGGVGVVLHLLTYFHFEIQCFWT